MGNNLNPASGINPVKIDAVINNYYGSSKALEIHFSVDKNLLSSVNTGLQGVKVLRDGAYFATTTPTQTYIWDHTGIVAGNTYTYDFIIITTDGRETKPSTYSFTAQ